MFLLQSNGNAQVLDHLPKAGTHLLFPYKVTVVRRSMRSYVSHWLPFLYLFVTQVGGKADNDGHFGLWHLSNTAPHLQRSRSAVGVPAHVSY